MHIIPVQLQKKNEFINKYRSQDEAVLNYFHYSPFNDDQRRLSYINKRAYQRNELVHILTEMNEDWGCSQETFDQINKLNDTNSVVVIGGQQAGLFTGPLYTINKVISIIQLARQKEEQLKIPVVPIFWIAGEDHDYDEINHVNMLQNKRMTKIMTSQYEGLKRSVSHIAINKEDTANWLKRNFQLLRETEHTKQLYEKLRSILQASKTFVDFFAKTIFYLFAEEGLVLFDSAHPLARQIERNYFVQLIEEQELFSEAVVEQANNLRKAGYPVIVDVEKNDTHLFFHDERNERILLKKEDGKWLGKNEEVMLTKEGLLSYAKNDPERLSNNVISRPIMQEFLFPTLSFVAGDGEISYWATLKKAFESFQLEMPPVIPRLSFTYVDQKIDSLLKEVDIPIEQAINEGVKVEKINWLQAQQTPPIALLTDQVQKEIEKIHKPLKETARLISDSVKQVAERNLQIIKQEIKFLSKKMESELMNKYEVELNKYDLLQHTLQPNGVLQERIWNPLPFLNEYDRQFIRELCQKDCSFVEEHFVIYL